MIGFIIALSLGYNVVLSLGNNDVFLVNSIKGGRNYCTMPCRFVGKVKRTDDNISNLLHKQKWSESGSIHRQSKKRTYVH